MDKGQERVRAGGDVGQPGLDSISAMSLGSNCQHDLGDLGEVGEDRF